MIELNKRLKEELIEKGADLVGFADLKEIEESNRESMRFGISVAVALSPRVIEGIKDGPTLEYFNEYNRVNNLLEDIVTHASNLIKSYGYKAIPNTEENMKINRHTLSTLLPKKTVATRAGLGWIGKSALLITKEYGSAVRISSVLTEAELDVGIPKDESECGACTICTDICPAKAIKGVNWNTKLERDDLCNPYECRRTARERSKKAGLAHSLCGLCILECPWTKKYLHRVL